MATFILYSLNLILYVLVLIRLIRTNHWSTGKKIVVGLVGSIGWYQAVACYLVAVYNVTIPLTFALLYSLPLTLMGLITVWAIYRKHIE